MALTVSSSLNQKTWDATVRVTGGHPNQLWGIGAVQQAAEGEKLTVDRVLVRDPDERMVGYAQLQIRHDNGRLVAEGSHVHVNKVAMVPAFMETLAGYVEDRYQVERLTLSADVQASEPLNDALTHRGWTRLDQAAEDDAGPRRLRVPLGATEKALSSRLSAETLDRCRGGLRVSDVTVREITANSGGVRAVGLKTGQINHLLKDLGQDSLLLVAAQERPGEQPEALGYLWFVHTVGLAMLYRVGFTRKARDLGIDDALLLTGAVELQKRGVQRMDGGNSQDKDVPTVVREMADRERIVLGTWRKDLVEIPQETPQPTQETAQKRRRFGRKHKPAVATQTPAADTPQQPEPQRVDEVRQQLSQDLGIEVTGITPAQREVEPPNTDPQAGAASGTPATAPVSKASSAAGADQGKTPQSDTERSDSAAPKESSGSARKRRRQEKKAAAKAAKDRRAHEAAPVAESEKPDVDPRGAGGETEQQTTSPETSQDNHAAAAPVSSDDAREAATAGHAGNPETAQSTDTDDADTTGAGEMPADEDTDGRKAAEPDADETHTVTPASAQDTDGASRDARSRGRQDGTVPEAVDSGREEPSGASAAEGESRADSGRGTQPRQGAASKRRNEPAAARTGAGSPETAQDAPKRRGGPLGFGKRVVSESVAAFKDALGR